MAATVGWRRQYEVDAAHDFCQAVLLFASEKPNDEKLQAFARKVKLKTIMLMLDEQKDFERGHIVKDRLADCAACRRQHGDSPCHSGAHECVHASPEEQLQVIRRHFGDEGIHFLEWAGRIIKKREGMA